MGSDVRQALPRLIAAVVLAAAACASSRAGSQPAVNPTGAAFKDFSDRLQQYLQVRAAAEAKVPDLTDTSDPSKISGREKALADAIRAGRPEAKQGDVFPASTVADFRRIIAEDFRKRTPPDRAAVLQEVPMKVPPRVNNDYPTSLPLATFPPALLRKLQRLPDELEYRFLGRHLILRDINANLIVDFIPDVVPPAGK